MKRIQCWIILLGMAAASGAQAEKADASKPTNIEANQMAYDDVKQINTFTGDVVLVRGTLTLKADRMVVIQDPAGYQYATLYAKRGEKATFRQKRCRRGCRRHPERTADSATPRTAVRSRRHQHEGGRAA